MTAPHVASGIAGHSPMRKPGLSCTVKSGKTGESSQECPRRNGWPRFLVNLECGEASPLWMFSFVPPHRCQRKTAEANARHRRFGCFLLYLPGLGHTKKD